MVNGDCGRPRGGFAHPCCADLVHCPNSAKSIVSVSVNHESPPFDASESQVPADILSAVTIQLPPIALNGDGILFAIVCGPIQIATPNC